MCPKRTNAFAISCIQNGKGKKKNTIYQMQLLITTVTVYSTRIYRHPLKIKINRQGSDILF